MVGWATKRSSDVEGWATVERSDVVVGWATVESFDGVEGCEKVNVSSMLVRCDEEADCTNDKASVKFFCYTSVVSCAKLVCCALVVG